MIAARSPMMSVGQLISRDDQSSLRKTTPFCLFRFPSVSRRSMHTMHTSNQGASRAPPCDGRNQMLSRDDKSIAEVGPEEKEMDE